MSLLSPTFAAQLNTKFRIALSDEITAELELIEVIDRTGPAGYECFTLIFRAPANMPALQGAYSMDHDHMGNLEIFLVPLANDQNGVTFEAVFNRWIDD